ncbi:MAG: type II toxin-antitoxin system HicA family toxin [FCB group bacterium]|nr:type II toxin-antitoxin system HicA family toxin [FCB group bacterium]
MKWPKDAPKGKVIKAMERLGFRMIREREHIAMRRHKADGTSTPLILPNHRRIKGSTLKTTCAAAKITREEFLTAYNQS